VIASISCYLHPHIIKHTVKHLRKSRIGTLFFFLLLALACNPRTGQEESGKGEIPQKESTRAPLLQADPVSEDMLRQAAYEGNEEHVKDLLGQGVDVNAADPEGRTALFFAAFNGHSKIILELIEAGASVALRDAMGRTALMYGSTGPFPEAVGILLDRGADPNAVDSDEHFTPLMHAAAEGHLEVVKALMNHGADPSLKDIDGDDAASFAQQAGHSQVVEYLKGDR